MLNLGRRGFIALIGGLAWPLGARAQQPAMPVIGFLHSGSPDLSLAAQGLTAFRKGLNETGFAEGRNVSIQYRWAEDRNERFPQLAAELVQGGVSLIAAVGSPAVAAAKAATTTIPIVFVVGVDPVSFGLVDSLSRPGANLTGVTNFSLETGPKRLELLANLLGSGKIVGILLNSRARAAWPRALSEIEIRDLQSAAHALGLQSHILYAGAETEFEAVFATLTQLGADGLAISGDPYFNSQAERLGALSLQHALPTIYQTREFTTAGGLISYGSSFAEPYRLAGIYTGRILQGQKSVDLPVQQPTTLELVINLKTARALGIDVPAALLARADEVIE
jgi:putative tryptophan/tyrosine transport system substrate-binding protein